MGERFERIVQVHKTRFEKVAPLVPTGAPAISMVNLAYSYTRKPFIEGFSLDIAHGKITSIVGPNGCGKSTLVKIADGLIVPHEGEVLIHGRPCFSMGSKVRARALALLAQGPRPPTMSVEALVACGRYPYQRGLTRRLDEEDKAKIDQAMALAGVDSLRDQDVRFLSGGERQRAFIAMILAQDTEIIVMDEPTTYLDVHACHEIMQLIRELNHNAGKTIVMVNHDIDLALRYSDQMAVMVKGKLLKAGDVDEVFASGAIEEAFQVEVCRFPDDDRTAYTLFPFANK